MKQRSSVKKVLKYLKPYRFLLILAVLFAIVSVSLTLYIPVLVGNAIDHIIGKGNVGFEDVAKILMYIGIAVVGVTVCQWLMTYFVNLVSFRTVRDLRRAVFRKLNTVPLSYIDTHAHGDLISRVINDVDAVGDGLTQMFLQLFSGGFVYFIPQFIKPRNIALNHHYASFEAVDLYGLFRAAA